MIVVMSVVCCVFLVSVGRSHSPPSFTPASIVDTKEVTEVTVIDYIAADTNLLMQRSYMVPINTPQVFTNIDYLVSFSASKVSVPIDHSVEVPNSKTEVSELNQNDEHKFIKVLKSLDKQVMEHKHY